MLGKREYRETEVEGVLERKSWEEFRKTGLFWFINTTLHTFGWALVAVVEDDKVVMVYPARVGFRGFSEDVNTEGYKKLSKYMKENGETLEEEANL